MKIEACYRKMYDNILQWNAKEYDLHYRYWVAQ